MKIKLLSSLFIVLLTTFTLTNSLANSPMPLMAQLVSFGKTNTTITYLRTSNLAGAADLVKIDARNGKVLKSIPFNQDGKLEPFASTPDGFKFLAKSAKGIAVIHNGTGKVLRTLPYPNNVRTWPITPVVSSSTVYLAVASNQHKIYFVHTGTGRIIRTINLVNASKDTFITAMGFSPNNKVFGYQTETNQKTTLHIYDINNQVELSTIQLSDSGENDLAYRDSYMIKFDGTGNQLITYTAGLPNKGIQLIDLKTQTVKTLKSGNFTFAGFSKNSRNILTVSTIEDKINNFDIQSGRLKSSNLGTHKIIGSLSSAVQSADKSIITVPYISQIEKKDGFLIIDSNTGNIIQNINNSAQ